MTDDFGGDRDAFARMYYNEVKRLTDVQEATVIAHFDLITKLDEQNAIFDSARPPYRERALSAMETLVAADKTIEMNAGAISRGYRAVPYPDRSLLEALRNMGGHVMIGADARCASGMACAFSQAEALAYSCGFREIYHLSDDGFIPAGLL